MSRTYSRSTDGQCAWAQLRAFQLAWFGLAMISTQALAQPPAAPAVKPPADSAAAPTVQPPLPGEVGPELYLLRDREGRLQAVPGFSFEDFIELYRLKNQLGGVEERPRYVISNAVMTGKVRGPVIASNLSLTIELGDSNWVRIPLGLSTSIVEGNATVDGTGEVLIECVDRPALTSAAGGAEWSASRTGYVLWLRGEAKKRQTVTIPLITSLSVVGDETQLRLEMPRSSTAQLVVEVPVAGALARVSDGATLLEPQTQPNRTTFSVVGASGLVELAWRPPGTAAPAAPSVLEASGLIWARIDGHSIGWEAKLSVRSFGGPFSGFRVRLPPGAQLLGDGQPGVNVVPVAADEGESATIVEVKLDRKTAGPVEVRLLADRRRNPDKPDELLELAGFEVLNVVRQWGSIGVQLVGNWQLKFAESRGVRQVDDVPEEVRREDHAAAFEYSSQPCSLMANVSPRRTRVSVQPQYVLEVGARETRIACDFKYTIRGAKLRSLSLRMPGWEIDEVGPPNLVNVDAAAITDAADFSIPLAQASNGDLAITVTARRATPGNGSVDVAHSFECELPRPQAEVVAPALVVVQPDDNVELNPRSDALVGLSLRSLRPTLKLPARQQDPLFYQSEGSASRFAGDLRVHNQKILVQSENRVDVEDQEVRVEQRLQYNIQYEPAEKLLLLVPRSIPIEKLEAVLDGSRLALTAAGDDKAGDLANVVPVSAALGGSRIGPCELVLSYRLPQEKLPPVTSVPLNIPLCSSEEGDLSQNLCWIRPGAGLLLNARKGAWRPLEPARDDVGAKRDGLWLIADTFENSIDLAVTLQDRSRETATLVERGWIQTWLTGSGRQDRVVLCLVTDERTLQIALPHGLKAEDVEATVDGQPKSLGPGTNGRFSLPLPASEDQQRYVIQLKYQVAEHPSTGSFTLEPPTLLPAAWMRQLYWQVFLPEHEHLVFSPAGFVNESQWNWSGRYWSRGPTLDSKELAQWIGLPADAAALTGSSRSYLFSAIGECPTMELRTVRRATLVFVASFCVLGSGLALMYFPVIRHPALLLAIAVATLGFGALAPDLAILSAQAGVLGLILVSVAVLLSLRADRTKEHSDALPATDQKESPEATATDLYYRAPANAPPQSTATSPMILPASGAEFPT